jgi:carboxyl-terminal processing protease
VRSDVVLPSLYDHADIGESFLEHALPFHTIAAARYAANALVSPEVVSALEHRSQTRVTANEDFQKLQRVIDRAVERKSRDTITLNEAELRKEREQDEKTEEVEKEVTEDGQPPAPDHNKPIFAKGPYNDEVLNITLDYLQLLNNRVTAKTSQAP